MFEDLKQGSGPTGPSVNSMPSVPKAPVADMFAEVDPSSSPNGMIKPSAVQSGKLRPASNNAWPVPDGSNVSVQPEQMLVTESRHVGNRKLIVTVAVVLLVLAFGAGAYFIFKDRINGMISKNQNTNQNTNVNNNQNTNQNRNTNINTNQNSNTNVNQGTLDDDFDGLDNDTEKSLGTNPLVADTDNDGLADRDEVKIYKTDPIKPDTDGDSLADGQEIRVWFTDPLLPDTDGDTYNDGSEVSNGYNPKGAGKLASTSTVPGLFEPINTNTNTNTDTNVNANINQ